MTSKTCANISLCDLRFMVNLGCTEQERVNKQQVSISIDLGLAEEPKGCITDDINDTICYHGMSKKIKELVENNQFNLIEHMAKRVLAEISLAIASIHQKVSVINVTVHKVNPPIDFLHGGAKFVCTKMYGLES